jgi:hypothetical protein
MISRISAVTLALAATGCATIVQGPDQRVAFETQPPGATVRANMQSCTTPCSLRLKRNRNLEAVIRKPGYAPETVYLRYELAPWILGNIAFLPLAPLGGVVDIVSGAGFKLYPPFVVVPLQRTGETPPPAEPRERGARPDAPDDDGDVDDAVGDEDWKPIPDDGDAP